MKTFNHILANELVKSAVLGGSKGINLKYCVICGREETKSREHKILCNICSRITSSEEKIQIYQRYIEEFPELQTQRWMPER